MQNQVLCFKVCGYCVGERLGIVLNPVEHKDLVPFLTSIAFVNALVNATGQRSSVVDYVTALV